MVQDDSRSTIVNTDTQPLQGAARLPAGSLLADRFKIIELLGHGGQAQVYRAHDQVLGIDIALKVVLTAHRLAQSEIDSMRNEVLLARQLNNPHIVRIYEFYQTQDYVFFTMALVSGRSLSAVLEQGVEPAQLDRWFSQLLDALQICHEAEIVHGDIKPANLMINDQDELVLVDFGIGKHLAAPLQTAGTSEFLAPEVKESGNLSAASDRYAAGKIMAEMLSALVTAKRPRRFSGWRMRRQRIVVGLQHQQPHQRLSIAACRDLLQPATTERMAVFGWAAGVAVLAVIGLMLWQQQTSLPAPAVTEQAATVIAITTDSADQELLDVAEFTQLSLQSLPNLYALDVRQVQQIQNNLAIAPANSQRDRERLAELVNSNLLVVLSRRQLGQDNFIHLLVTEAPGDRVRINTRFDLSTNRLAAIPGLILETLSAELDQSDIPLELDESTATLLQAIQHALADGDQQQALVLLNRLKEEDAGRFWLLRGDALLAASKGNYQQAATVLDKLLADYPNRPDLLAERAALAFATNDLSAAKKYYQQAVAGDPGQAIWWFELAKIKIIQGDIRDALDNELLQALVRFRQNEDAAGQGLVLNAFGVAHLRLAQFSTAADYFSEALTYRTAESAPSDRVTTLSNLATAQAIEGDYQQADQNLQEAQKLVASLNDALGVAHIENERGLLMEEQGFYTEALGHYKTALDIRLQAGDDYQQSQSINNVAFIHFLLGDFSLAEVYWRQALQVLEDMEETAVLHSTQTNLAQLLVIRGQFQQAEQVLAQILAHQDISPEAEFATYLQLSKLNFAQSRVAVAAENITQAISIAARIKDNRAVTESLLWAAEIAVNLHQRDLLNKYLTELAPLVAEFNVEQELYYRWLLVRQQLQANAGNAHSNGLDLIDSVLTRSVSRISEARILADLAGRFALPADHAIWQRLEQIISPAMYEAYLAYLAAQNAPAAQQSLRAQLARYPLYWRNFEFYTALPGSEADALADSALQRLYGLMNDEQRQAYQQFADAHRAP